MEANLASPTDIAGFRAEARQLLAQQVPPEHVIWSAPRAPVAQRAALVRGDAPRPAASAASAIVPASYVRLCEYVVQHRDPERFALLYSLLWRLVHEPGLRHAPADPDMSRAQHMAHAVRRDIHKLKATLRFRSVFDPAHPQEPLLVACCEPAHRTLLAVAPWFAKRNGAARWMIHSPEHSLYCDGKLLCCAPVHAGCVGAHASLHLMSPDAEWLARLHDLFGP